MKKLAFRFVGFTTVVLMISSEISMANDPKPGAWRGQSITEFSAAENTEMNWRVVDDGVMGGLSKGQLEFADGGILRFHGNLSLENNGGFSSIRTEAIDLNLSNDLGILLRVKGDGRRYQVRLESDARYRQWPVSFSGEFDTVAGEWMQVKVPFSSFEGSFRGRDLPEAKLDPSQIYRLGILLADKQPGAFELHVDWVRTYGKGQGNYRERVTDRSSESSGQANHSEPTSRERLRDGVYPGRFVRALIAVGLMGYVPWK